jgi:PAS domain S-box-containing protein
VIAMGIRSGLGMMGVSPYLQMLAIPVVRSNQLVATAAWLGGLSAGGAMVVVELTAISAMVSNEIILPLVSSALRERQAGSTIGGLIVLVRRVTIGVIAGLAWAYYMGVRGVEGPTDLGLTALTAFAQLVPPLLGGLYWRRGHAHGALAGVAAGAAVWAVAIAAPSFVAPWQAGHSMADGLGGDLWSVHGRVGAQWAIFASLLVNTACFIVFSRRARPRLIDIIQANSFVASDMPTHDASKLNMGATMADLRHLLAQFLGEAEANRTLFDIASSGRVGAVDDRLPVSPKMVRAAERVLAGVIGASSARNVVAIAMATGQRDAEEIGRILDEAGHAVHFSRELLQATLESLPQGVCVVDARAHIVAWNSRYLEIMGLAHDNVHVGKALGSLPALAEHAQAYRRWREARGAGAAMQEELTLSGGRIFTLAGRPLAGGDYLMTLTDISDLKQAEQVLERRVDERTRALTIANAAMEAARRDAEQATGTQRRFVAAASHDLVQPLHAARLFIGNALLGAQDGAQRDLLLKADQSVEGAHRLLLALLKLSQLELGALRPRLEPVDAGELLSSLAAEFEPMAKARRLELVVFPSAKWVMTDRDLLRSILQNLLVNALRYTHQGRVVVVARRAGDGVRFEVRDTGVGIADEHLPIVFGEFSRLVDGQQMAEGAGLGLSIVARIAHALGHRVGVASKKGVGSVFSVQVAATAPQPRRVQAAQAFANLQGLRVLCVEDDEDVLMATSALIERWGGVVSAVSKIADLPDGRGWDVAIADYNLGQGDGLSLLRDLAPRADLRILVTATPEPGWADSLPGEAIHLLRKPLPPLALHLLLQQQALALNRAPE